MIQKELFGPLCRQVLLVFICPGDNAARKMKFGAVELTK